jgi:hypothetical protein
MPLSRALRRFPALPAAACLALVLGACLDNSLPVDPVPESPAGTVADDTPPGRQNRIIPFDSMPLRDRFDSSRRAMRAQEARSKGTYEYERLRFAGWPFGPDTTRVGFEAGRAILREAWYTVDETPTNYPEWETHTLLRLIAHEHYLEAGDVGAHPYGEAALPLDSLYARCEAMLPPASDPDFRFTVGPEHILRECGLAAANCYGNSCLPEIALKSLEWAGPIRLGRVDDSPSRP